MIPRSAAVLLFAGLAAAQSTPPPMVVQPLPARGMMSGLSAGLIFENRPATLVHKGPRLPAVLNTLASQLVPDCAEYDLDAVVEHLNVAHDVRLPSLAVDAISTGNDLLPIAHVPGPGAAPGYYQVTYGHEVWATLAVVYEEGDEHPAADIVGYYFDNRSFPNLLRNTVVHEILATELASGTFDPQETKITALDFAMGQILANRGLPDPGILDCVNRLYFSLTRDCAYDVSLLGPPFSMVDGSTIFEVHYNMYGDLENVTWFQPPAPLEAGTAELDIDALGVAYVTVPSPAVPPATQIHVGRMLLVSYTATVGGEELFAIAHDQPTSFTALPLRSPTMQKLAGPGGLKQGRVKGLCGRDPEAHFGARSFGVPAVDFVQSTDDAVTLSSTHVLSVEVATVTSDTSAPSGLDEVTLSGVVAGAPQNGCDCILWVLHKGQYRWFPLGVWPANQTYLPFSIDLDTPWAKPGPNSTLVRNEYELIVTMLPGPTSTVPLALSNRALVRRNF